MPLRPFQSAAVASVEASPHRRVLLIAPTGAGKTVMAAALAANEIARGGRVLFLAHTREIYAQGVKRLPQGTRVAMVQTLTRKGVQEFAEATGDPTLVIVDEVHHSVAESWRRLLNRFACRMVGLTATPWSDGMVELWDDTVVAALPSELARDGYLSPLRIITHGAPDTSRVTIRGGEYDPAQLAAVTNVSELRGDILQTYLQHTPTLPAFGFAVNVAHSKALAADFTAAGIPSEHIDGDSRDRDAILERFRSGQTRVLWNCDLLGEGVDIDGAQCAILARSLHSLRAYLQQAGRVRAPGAVGWILDHGGNVERHGSPRMDRDYSLTAGGGARATRKRSLQVAEPRLRLVVECPADAYQIDPEFAAMGFEPQRETVDASDEITERQPPPHPVDAWAA